MNLERLLHSTRIELEAVETKRWIWIRTYKVFPETGEKKLLSTCRKRRNRNRRGYKNDR